MRFIIKCIRIQTDCTLINAQNVYNEGRYIPNQPHLLKKYQINMGFSYFNEIGILSGMNHIE